MWVEKVQYERAGALGGARVLIVEDDFFILTELEGILTDAGAQAAVPCRNVSEALWALDRHCIEVAILDVRLGGETVAPVARELSRRQTPFLFYTGQIGSDPDLAEWSTGRDCRIIGKPAASQTIVAALADLFNR